MARRSTSASKARSGIESAASPAAVIAGSVDSSTSRCSGSIVRPRAAMTARASVFSSCRTLPGQGRSRDGERAPRRDSESSPAVRPLDALQDVFDQRLDIFGAVAERRDDDSGDVQAVIEILAESAGGDLFGQVAVRRRDDAGIGVQGLSPADALELALLDDAEDLDLGRQRQLADLVEKNRASGGAFEPAGLLAVGAGECAALVAEELALDQPLGKRPAVDADERAGLRDRNGDGARLPPAPCRCRFRPGSRPGHRSRRPVRSSCRPRASRRSGRSAQARVGMRLDDSLVDPSLLRARSDLTSRARRAASEHA